MPPSATVSARARVRAELTEEIKELARRQLAEKGAADLSVRAVAREMGIVSSAIYRYFPSRDDLLTALIIDAYNGLGDAGEAADAGRAEDPEVRLRAVCRAVRGWAVEHPQEYALVFGSPVPGYVAPSDTIGPYSRLPAVVFGIITDAFDAGAIDDRDDIELGGTLLDDAERVGEAIAPNLPAPVVIRALAAWPALFGAISFELFGHFQNVIDDKAALFDYELERIMRLIGFRVRPTA